MPMKRLRLYRLGSGFLLVGVLANSALPQEHEQYKALTNSQVLEMLNAVESDIKKNYWDPKLNGLDMDKTFAEARQKIVAARSQNEALLYVAGAVDGLKDSHTRFVPPEPPYRVEQGWRAQIIGTKCYVTHVQPGSDAEAKGLKAGDEIVLINGFKITPENFAALTYGYTVFQQSGFRLLVRSRDGNGREITAMAKVLPGQKVVTREEMLAWFSAHAHDSPKDHSYYAQQGGIILWKLPDFDVEPETMDASIHKTKSFSALVLDLRGNRGGSGVATARLLGAFFDHDVHVANRKRRKGGESIVAKGRGRKAYSGKLIVLIDRNSASAAEILARVIQLEKRGIVIGDRSAGAVMEAQYFPHTLSLSPASVTTYAVEVTNADLVMADGGRLESIGVTPDEQILPSPADLESARDPALARAAELAGVQITPEEAGKLFPVHWLERVPEID
jgi:C-terminal processing protease CtpA/Prc